MAFRRQRQSLDGSKMTRTCFACFNSVICHAYKGIRNTITVEVEKGIFRKKWDLTFSNEEEIFEVLAKTCTHYKEVPKNEHQD